MEEVTQKLRNFILDDPKSIRMCMMYDVIGGLHPYHAYHNLRHRLGNDVMEYQEFEFWYMRLSRGETDLDYDRSQDPKPKNLLNMPLDVMDRIVAKLEPMDKLRFRKVSKHLTPIVDSTPLDFKKITVIFNAGQYTMTLEYGNNRGGQKYSYESKHQFYYHTDINSTDLMRRVAHYPLPNVELNEGYCRVSYGCFHGKVLKANPIDLLLLDLNLIIKKPSCELEELTVINYSSETENFKKFEIILKNLDHRLKVQKLKITTNYCNEESMILPYLEPGTLKEIFIDMRDFGNQLLGSKKEILQFSKERFDKIAESDQWKLATERILHVYNKDTLTAESFVNNTVRLNVHLKFESKSMLPVIKILKALITSPVLEQCTIETKFNLSPTQINRAVNTNPLFDHNGIMPLQVLIPNTTDYFQVTVYHKYVRILRRKQGEGFDFNF